MVCVLIIVLTFQSIASKFIPFADRVLLKKIVPVAKVVLFTGYDLQTVGGILLPEDSVPQRNECEVGIAMKL